MYVYEATRHVLRRCQSQGGSLIERSCRRCMQRSIIITWTTSAKYRPQTLWCTVAFSTRRGFAKRSNNVHLVWTELDDIISNPSFAKCSSHGNAQREMTRNVQQKMQQCKYVGSFKHRFLKQFYRSVPLRIHCQILQRKYEIFTACVWWKFTFVLNSLQLFYSAVSTPSFMLWCTPTTVWALAVHICINTYGGRNTSPFFSL